MHHKGLWLLKSLRDLSRPSAEPRFLSADNWWFELEKTSILCNQKHCFQAHFSRGAIFFQALPQKYSFFVSKELDIQFQVHTDF